MNIWHSQDLEQMLQPSDWLSLQTQVYDRFSPSKPIATQVKSKLSPLPNVRGVLFDVYGTLVISASGEVSTAAELPDETHLTQGESQALETLPQPLRSSISECFSPSKELKKQIVKYHKQNQSPTLQYPEVDIIALWHRIFLQQLPKDMHSKLSLLMLARFALEYELQHNPTPLMPGCLELITWLAARDFYMGIISNAQFYTPIILATLLGCHNLENIHILPDLCFWSYHYGYSKPQPELFQHACKALAEHDLQPSEILYLGNDMRNDVWGAAQAGFLTALFAGDQRSLRLRTDIEEVATTQPNLIITELRQLKSVL